MFRPGPTTSGRLGAQILAATLVSRFWLLTACLVRLRAKIVPTSSFATDYRAFSIVGRWIWVRGLRRRFAPSVPFLAGLLVCSLMAVIPLGPGPAALINSEVQALAKASPEFRAAEEEIISVWKQLTPDTRAKLQKSQIQWIQTLRDQEANKLMKQGHSFAEAYTIATRNKIQELRQHLAIAPSQVQPLTDELYRRFLSESPRFKSAEDELNAVWVKIMAALDPVAKERLRLEQTQWLQTKRDQDAYLLAATQQQALGDAYAAITEERTNYLKTLLSSFGTSSAPQASQPTAAALTGVYSGPQGTLTLGEMPGGKLGFELSIGSGVCTGELSGVATMGGPKAIFKDGNCRELRLTFSPGQVDIREIGCNYYHGAQCVFDGVYVRTK